MLAAGQMIFVLADTHVPERMAALPRKFSDLVKPGDVIFHAGDFVRWEVLRELEDLATVHGVRGNMDEPRIRRLLPESKVVEVQGKKIAISHGSGSPHKLGERVYRELGKECDVLIFGHSHAPLNKKIDHTLLFNPGSLSGNLVPPFAATYGVLTIEGDDLWGEIFEI
jgi:putative phosphoesterase